LRLVQQTGALHLDSDGPNPLAFSSVWVLAVPTSASRRSAPTVGKPLRPLGCLFRAHVRLPPGRGTLQAIGALMPSSGFKPCTQHNTHSSISAHMARLLQRTAKILSAYVLSCPGLCPSPVTRRSQALSRFGQFRLFAEGQSPAKAGGAALHLWGRCCRLSRTNGDQHETHFGVRFFRFDASLF
jgi:hypothetical protein